MLKLFVRKKLERYTKQYFAKHPDVKLVVVVGSVGKTSSKNAIATILSEKYRVRMDKGNHNTELAAPCAMLGIKYPDNIRSLKQWYDVFRYAKLRVEQPTDVDIVVQELGTDHPGDIKKFGKYLKPDIAVVTAVTPEHMEFFGTLENVAKEELSVTAFSDFTLINRDDVSGEYAGLVRNSNFSTYGTTGAAEYRFEPSEVSPEHGYAGRCIVPEDPNGFELKMNVIGEHSARVVMAGVAVASRLGLDADTIAKGVENIVPVPGRMNPLRGLENTTVIDDSYNSSPAAAEAALRTLFSYDEVPQRIAVLGDMRELGTPSPEEHKKLGELCDPNLLAWVVTVGPDMEKYLTPAARLRGCQVQNCRNAIEAAKFVRRVTEPGAVILVKGSQNTIYLEETVKLLVDIAEDKELVRQSEAWMKKKEAFFRSEY